MNDKTDDGRDDGPGDGTLVNVEQMAGETEFDRLVGMEIVDTLIEKHPNGIRFDTLGPVLLSLFAHACKQTLTELARDDEGQEKLGLGMSGIAKMINYTMIGIAEHANTLLKAQTPEAAEHDYPSAGDASGTRH